MYITWTSCIIIDLDGLNSSVAQRSYSSCAQAKDKKTIQELQLAVKRLRSGESTGKDRRAESGSDPSKDPKVIAAVLKANAEK